MARLTWPHGPRPTVRLQLTVLFLAVFVAAGAVLMLLTYLLVQHALASRGVVIPPRGDGAAARVIRPPSDLPKTVTQLRQLMLHYREQLETETLHEVLVQGSIALGVT